MGVDLRVKEKRTNDFDLKKDSVQYETFVVLEKKKKILVGEEKKNLVMVMVCWIQK